MSALDTVLSWLVLFLPVGLAIVLHEIAHGCAALWFGDTTAKREGRLSLNPLRHVDAIGTVLFPLLLVLSGLPFVFGWAKPVPVNFARLKNPKKDMVWVALAGPLTNLALALAAFFMLSVCRNILHVLPPALLARFLVNTVIFNLSVMAFNLIPVLPLDGGRILTGILPLPLALRFARTEKYGMGIMVFLLIFLPAFGGYAGIDLNFVSDFMGRCVQSLLVYLGWFFGLDGERKLMSIGFFQLMVILLIVLVLFGRGKLPALAEDLGKSFSAFKKGLKDGEDDKLTDNRSEENKDK